MIHIETKIKRIIIAAGSLISLSSAWIYYSSGFNWMIFLFWLLGLGVAAFGFYKKGSEHFIPKTTYDSYAVYALLVIFLPLYFAFLYTIPYQMNTDEAVIMTVQKQLLQSPDLFAKSDYFGFPSMIFIVTGWLADVFGGGMLQVRLVHAGFGILTILFSYVFFRQFWKAMPSFAAAAIIGANHSLLAISRMAMRDNSALLVMVASLPFLFYGLKHKSHFHTFIGGLIAGLSFYVYHPGRILIFLWIGTLALIWFFVRQHYSIKQLSKLLAITILGFLLVYAPLFAAGLKYTDPAAGKFERERFLFYEEGRQLQREWVAAGSVSEGVMTNIVNGLTTFNNRVHDHGYIYVNYGFGFMDPITGILLWAGLIGIIFKIFWVKHANEEDLLAVGSFIFLWLLFSFVVNKSPIYTRLFVTLPFVAYLVVIGITEVGGLLSMILKKLKFHDRKYVVKAFMLEAVFIIVLSNMFIFGAFAKKGMDEGDSVGGTGRYIEDRKVFSSYSFYLASDSNNMYYNWGDSNAWTSWMRVFAHDNHVTEVLPTDNFVDMLPANGNFTVFLNQDVWEQNKGQMLLRYSKLRVHNITTDGRLLAVEILPAGQGNTTP